MDFSFLMRGRRMFWNKAKKRLIPVRLALTMKAVLNPAVKASVCLLGVLRI